MAPGPRRLAKRSTPRPARRPSAGSPAENGFLCWLAQEGPQARRARQQRMRDAHAAAVAKARDRIEAAHELWQSLAGEPMPLELADMQSAAVHFGLPGDVVHRGDFTLAEVTNFMVGKRQAALDELHDRVRAAEAEAAVWRAAGIVTPSMSTPAGDQAEAVDDKYAGIARRLSDNARSYLRYLLVHNAFDRASLIEQHGLAADLGISFGAVRAAAREIRRVLPPSLESASGRKGGVWLTPAGKLVAERIPASTCRQKCLAETGTKKHQTGVA